MKFTLPQILRLKEIWSQKEEITIEGITGRGDKFVTTGRVSAKDSGKPSVYEESIYLEFGISKTDRSRKQTNYFAPFELNFDESYFGGRFMVFSIKTASGEVIFENTDKEVIEELAIENGQKLKRRHKYIGRVVEKPDAVTAKLKEMIGKPVYFDGYTGVVAYVDGYIDSGNALFGLALGPFVGNLHVKENSKLMTEDNAGVVEIIARNKPEETRKLIEERASKIENADEKEIE